MIKLKNILKIFPNFSNEEKLKEQILIQYYESTLTKLHLRQYETNHTWCEVLLKRDKTAKPLLKTLLNTINYKKKAFVLITCVP